MLKPRSNLINPSYMKVFLEIVVFDIKSISGSERALVFKRIVIRWRTPSQWVVKTLPTGDISTAAAQHYLRNLNPQTQRDHGQGLPEEFLSGFGNKVLLCSSGWPIIHSNPPALALSTGILGVSHHAQHSWLERNCLPNNNIYEYLLSEIHRVSPSKWLILLPSSH